MLDQLNCLRVEKLSLYDLKRWNSSNLSCALLDLFEALLSFILLVRPDKIHVTTAVCILVGMRVNMLAYG